MHWIGQKVDWIGNEMGWIGNPGLDWKSHDGLEIQGLEMKWIGLKRWIGIEIWIGLENFYQECYYPIILIIPRKSPNLPNLDLVFSPTEPFIIIILRS